MADKLQLLFAPEMAKGGNDKMYKKAFKVRDEMPKDFILSVLISAMTDATESKASVFMVKEKLFRSDDVLFQFKKV